MGFVNALINPCTILSLIDYAILWLTHVDISGLRFLVVTNVKVSGAEAYTFYPLGLFAGVFTCYGVEKSNRVNLLGLFLRLCTGCDHLPRSGSVLKPLFFNLDTHGFVLWIYG